MIRLTLNIFWQISSSPPRTANNIFLALLLVFVVARITHVIALRADARLVLRMLHQYSYYILHTFFTRIRWGDYNASSGFGPEAKTLRGQ